ncbi:MAG: UDP-2,3-diacylglucosamine diphosphatase [Gammaproteobacteria bacterium]|nr:UDP-2,3-diacylglucosamine diphosphatase [Gammaproteobacteria bacterium]
MTVYFLSDLHLCDERPRINALFVAFLTGPARQAQAVYILGDLLEYWVGDDTLTRDPPGFVAALRALTTLGIPTFLMHGNRDFLLGAQFADATGCPLMDDPTVISLFGTPTLLMHGDTLCTDDTAYQNMRAQVRDPKWQQQVLAQTWEQRIALAKRYRSESQKQTRDKPEYITDVNQQAVEAAMRTAGVTRLIHGHTHRPAVHEFMLDGQPAQRFVLPDWYQNGGVLEWDERGYRMLTL